MNTEIATYTISVRILRHVVGLADGRQSAGKTFVESAALVHATEGPDPGLLQRFQQSVDERLASA